MKKQKIILALATLSITAAIGYNVHYVLAVPATPLSNSGQRGPSMNSITPTYAGATTIGVDTTLSDVSYKSSTGAENALLVSGGTVNLAKITVEKSGDVNDENSDFYGTNAAILAYNGATLNLSDSTIATGGTHANGVFAYGTGTINISDSKISTYKNNSGGIMVTGGGTLNATNLNIETAGNSSAAIRSDRGGGAMIVEKGFYKTTGQGSPAIYSTADISVKDATLISTASEGVVIEGKNSVALDNVVLTDTNNTLNGNSETYKNIFIYQSMSGDASEGAGTFTAKNSDITTNQGDVFYVTNTAANIELVNVNFLHEDADGVFLRAEGAKWGDAGQNGGDVTLSLAYQDVYGDIVLDEISSLDLQIGKDSYFWGTINEANVGNVKLAISSGSIFVLGGDTYVNTLENGQSDNSNIYANGHKLYVDGAEVAVNEATPPERGNNPTEPGIAVDSTEETNLAILIAAITAGGLALIAIIIVAAIAIKKRKSASDHKNVVTTEMKEPKIDAKASESESAAPGETQYPKDIDVNDISPTDKE